MQMKLLLLIIALIWGCTASAQSNGNQIKILGYVFAEKENEKLPFVHVLNTQNGLGVISDTAGFFTIHIAPTDTLIFQCLGYEPTTYFVSDTVQTNAIFINVPMQQTTFKLQQIDVMALSDKSQFKHDFIHLKVPNNEMRIIIPGVTKYLERKERVIPVQYTAMSPISAMYYRFSKTGKSLQKYIDLLEQDAIASKAAQKYNKQVVYDLSGFTTDTLNAFYDYMNLTNNYILKTDEYHIYKRVLDSLPLYKLRLSTDTAFYNQQFDFDF